MSTGQKLWLNPQIDSEKVEKLYQEIGTNKYLCEILVQRGIESYDQAKSFFRPQISDLHDPFLMKGMQESLDRIMQSIAEEKKILLYGDYDVDGTMAVSMMYNFLIDRYENIEYYIPHRLNEGYGLSPKAVEYANKSEVDLLITMDCGIKNNFLIQEAKKNGIDTIVIDHHKPGTELPPAFAILNPKQKEDNYPFKELSGAGIVFKFLSAWSILEMGDIDHALKFLDLAALSTIADIVPLLGENRSIARLGIDLINKNLNPAINEIKKVAGIEEQEVSDRDVGYVIGPRINALGRLEEASRVVDIFTSRDIRFIQDEIKRMNKLNEERRLLDQNMAEEAMDKLKLDALESEKKSTVLKSKDWHKGVIGIVASRVLEQYYKPTIICSEKDGLVTCSARSVRDFNILEALNPIGDLFESYGGHKYAAGLRLKLENYDAFVQRFEEIVATTISEHSLHMPIVIDCQLNDLNFDLFKFYNTLVQMAPFGEANPEPTFRLNQVEVDNVRILKEKHVACSIRKGDVIMRSIGFNLADRAPILESYRKVDLCFQFQRNEFRGNVSIEMKLLDAKLSST